MQKKLKRILIIILILLFIVSGIRFIYNVIDPRGFFGIGLPSKMKVHVNETGNFLILHPETWTAVDTPQGNHGDLDNIAIIKPFRTWPSLHIAAKEFPEGNFDQVAQWGETRIDVFPHYNQKALDNFATPNISGISRAYVWQADSLFSKEIPIQCTDYYTLVNDTGYILQFCTEQSQRSDMESVFQQMIDSFQVR